MVEFRWIQMSFLLTRVLQITAAVHGPFPFFFNVREGAEVTLICENVPDDDCVSTTWLFSSSSQRTDTLFEHGQIHKNIKSGSRLSVTEKCSLVIKRVTTNDTGRYTCRHFRSGQTFSDTSVFLDVATGKETGVTRQDFASVIVREGGDVTLPCRAVTNDLRNCGPTAWRFSPTATSSAKDLVVQRQTDEKAKAKPDRLSVTENCSLVVKKVTVEDVGRYICDDVLDLSVVKVTEHMDDGKVTLNCSVRTRGKCLHTVKWLFGTGDVGPDHSALKTTQSDCSSTVTFTTTHYIYNLKNYNSLKCNVTDGDNRKVQQFTFNSEPSGSGNKETPTKAERDIPQQSLLTDLWWLYVVAAVGSAALLITVVALVRRKRNKANKTQREENMADPEDVSYTSITFNKKTNSIARVRGADEAVTYSTVKTPSSSAGASIDPKSLYATIN